MALDLQLDAELAQLADAAERTLRSPGSRASPAAPDLSVVIDDARGDIRPGLTEPGLPQLTDEAPAPPFTPVPEDDGPGFGEDFDADIAAIFGEEATRAARTIRGCVWTLAG